MPLLRYGVASACEWSRLYVFDSADCENLIVSMLCQPWAMPGPVILVCWLAENRGPCVGSMRTG
jgi:hypothetical protein